MPNPINPDGTVQVAPPTQSAFAQSLAPTGAPIQPTHLPVQARNTATPGFSGAIMDLIRSLVTTFGPKQIVNRQQNIEQGINKGLGNEF